MLTEELPNLIVEQRAIASNYLKRYVIIDFYLPRNINNPGELSLLLINDGQNLQEMKFSSMTDQLIGSAQVQPLVCAGIHAGWDRKNEYGTAGVTDFEGRGAKAGDYHRFIIEELLPFIYNSYAIPEFRQIAFAGFSLGGLMAFDITWHYPDIFSIAGVFSGSLWWRTKSLDDDYNDDTDRIIHQKVKNGSYKPGLKFYFTTGSQDETADRNNNGIIDSIDDTMALISELVQLGYDKEHDIRYVNYEDGKHDVETWSRAMPAFLLWSGAGNNEKEYRTGNKDW